MKELKWKPFLKLKDHSVSKEDFQLQINEELQLLRTFPFPKEEDLPTYYKSDKYISHSDKASSIFEWVYHQVKKLMFLKKLSWIRKFKKEGRILDIGAGTGEFLFQLKKKNWKVEGVEPNKKAREIAAQKNLTLHETTASLENKKFDVITLWHVLEHIPHLEKQTVELSNLLCDDGILIIAVPNFKSFDAKTYKEFWAAYDVPRHLWHFSKQAIEKIFKDHFTLVETKPLPLDAFYVSILSEKYRNGRENLLKGFYYGLRSNLEAFKTKEYSSQVYFLQKNPKNEF